MLTGQDAPEFAWAVEMPLLTNRFFLYDGFKLFLWVTAILAAVFLAVFVAGGSRSSIVTVLEMFGWIIVGILYLFVFIAWIFFRDRFAVGFRITSQGISWVSLSRRARVANRVAVVAGAIGGSLTGVGAGMLAISQESGSLPWGKLRRIRKYPLERVVTIRNSWRVVTRLYCTPENYPYVTQLVDWYMALTRPSPAVP